MGINLFSCCIIQSGCIIHNFPSCKDSVKNYTHTGFIYVIKSDRRNGGWCRMGLRCMSLGRDRILYIRADVVHHAWKMGEYDSIHCLKRDREQIKSDLIIPFPGAILYGIGCCAITDTR